MIEKQKKELWVEVLLIITALILFFMTAIGLVFLETAYNEWSWYDVQDRVYEGISMTFASLQFMLFFLPWLVITVIALLKRFQPNKEPGKTALFIQQHGLILAAGFVALLLLFLTLRRGAVYGIENTVETCEVPLAMGYYFRKGWSELAAELSLENAVISFFSWVRGHRKGKEKENKVEAGKRLL